MAVTTPLRGPSSQDSEHELFTHYHEHGDPASRRELVERFLPFARKLALRYSYTDEPLDDLVQVASVGLIGAIDRFEPDRGASFTSFAAPTILGELKRHFRDKGWTVHVPRELQERRSPSAGRRSGSPTISAGLRRSMSSRRPWVARSSRRSRPARSRTATRPRPSTPRRAGTMRSRWLSSSLSVPIDENYALAESRELIADTWRSLSPLEREVVALRFAEGLTQRQIGQRIGYSQMHVSRLLRRSLSRILAAPRVEDEGRAIAAR